ncbi:MAG: nucleotide exchange factor GrpE [Ruminococcaceae bacterium]|nr:nucleotide exchange factor GrpE [Oscillospiraceae bacterium]
MTDEMKNEAVEETAEMMEESPVEEVPTEEASEAKGGKESKKKQRQLEAENLQLKKELEAQKAELAAKNDQCLRIAAEYDNFRKRSVKEREGIYTDAYADALAALFPVVDNLERAAMYSDGENVAKGVAMTLKGIEDTFEKLGVVAIDPKGEAFDPQLHNAVMHVEDPEYGESIVVEVLQKGYRRGDRILRYAMVKVAN